MFHLQFKGLWARWRGPIHGGKNAKKKKILNFYKNIKQRSIKYAKKYKNNEKNPSPKFRPVGPFDWPETWSKNDQNEKFFKFRTKLLLGSLKYAEYEKLVKKINLQNFGTLARLTGPKHGVKMIKMKSSSNFVQNYS